MIKTPALVLALTITPALYWAPAPLVAKPQSVLKADTSQIAVSGDTTARTSAAEADSLQAAKPKNSLSDFIDWVSSHDGLWSLLALLGGIGGAVWAFLKRKRELKPKVEIDTRDAKARYRDYIITAHQHLPVAGFETNLRVPIPLEKVYVSLQARMAEIDRARDGRREIVADFREFQADRTVTVQEALQFALGKNYDGVVILGQPGSGKTTLAKYFLLCFATNKAEKNLRLSQKLLPILLFLREVDPEKSCVENILAALQKHQLGLDAKFFLPYLQKGEAILLLDGLDEVPTEEKRQQVSQWIHQQVHLTCPRCPVIVTSRFSGYRASAVLPGYYLRLEIQDYQLEQVKQFLENWLTAVETHVHENRRYWRHETKQKAEDLHRRIEATKALHDKDEQIAGTARTILAKWGEVPVETKFETIITVIKGKIEKIPQRLFNPVELNAEYILIPGAKEKIVLAGTKKTAPDYPLYFAKYPVTNKLYRRFIEYLAGKNKEELQRLPREIFANSLLAQAEKIEGFSNYLGSDTEAWAEKLRSSYNDEKRFNSDEQPVVSVTWFAATAYCHWLTELHKNDHKAKINRIFFGCQMKKNGNGRRAVEKENIRGEIKNPMKPWPTMLKKSATPHR